MQGVYSLWSWKYQTCASLLLQLQSSECSSPWNGSCLFCLSMHPPSNVVRDSAVSWMIKKNTDLKKKPNPTKNLIQNQTAFYHLVQRQRTDGICFVGYNVRIHAIALFIFSLLFLFFKLHPMWPRRIVALISFLTIFFVKEAENKSRLSDLLTTLGLLSGNRRSSRSFTSCLLILQILKKIDKGLIALMPQVSLLCSAKICLLNKVLVENNVSKGDAEWLLQLWLIGSSFFKWKDSQDILILTSHLLNSWLITIRVLVWLCQGLRDSYNQNRRDSSFYHREGLGKDLGLKLEPLSWENGSFPVVSLWGAVRNPALQMNCSSLHPEDVGHLSVCRGRVRGSQEWNLYWHQWLLSTPKKWAGLEFYSSAQHWWPFEFEF